MQNKNIFLPQKASVYMYLMTVPVSEFPGTASNIFYLAGARE